MATIAAAIEHVAFVVADPEAVADWYCRNLGMKQVRRGGGGDIFISDASGHVILQLEDVRLLGSGSKGGEAVYAGQDPQVLHLAFCVDDVAGVRQQLLDAGATPDADIVVTDEGDEMTTLRDPWGLPFQILKRKDPMLPTGD
jgi:catechol 2,3-dioxygenase-like lactoylglutathione lyase family enzyme